MHLFQLSRPGVPLVINPTSLGTESSDARTRMKKTQETSDQSATGNTKVCLGVLSKCRSTSLHVAQFKVTIGLDLSFKKYLMIIKKIAFYMNFVAWLCIFVKRPGYHLPLPPRSFNNNVDQSP